MRTVVWAGISPAPIISATTELGRPTCYRCLRPQPCCVCASIHPVANRTRVVIVQHPRERRHPFGTVRLARLGLRNVDVIVADHDREGLTRCPPCSLPGAALLFPSPDAPRLDPRVELAAPPPALVVLDGTWSSAGKLRRDNPWIQALPTVALAPSQPGRYRIRKAPRPAVQLSTIEAIVSALETIEPDTVGLSGLLRSFDAMVDRQLAIERVHRAPEPRPPRSADSLEPDPPCGNG